MGQNTNANTNWGELFSLYSRLVGPFKEFEKCAYNKRTIEQDASDARETINYSYRGIIKKAFVHTVIGAIPFLIIFFVVVNVVHIDGEKLYYHYENFIDPAANFLLGYLLKLPFFQNHNTFSNLLGMILALLICFVLFPCLMFLFPLMIVCNVIHRAQVISNAKKTLKTCEEILPQADAVLREAWKSIAPYIEKIPKDYRNSKALAFFSNSFFNSKVSTLPEAVNLYDQYLHQQRMEQNQREMAQAQRDAMNDISRQLDYLHSQMDSMEIEISSLH